jgi:hypothetical protein
MRVVDLVSSLADLIELGMNFGHVIL